MADQSEDVTEMEKWAQYVERYTSDHVSSDVSSELREQLLLKPVFMSRSVLKCFLTSKSLFICCFLSCQGHCWNVAFSHVTVIVEMLLFHVKVTVDMLLSLMSRSMLKCCFLANWQRGSNRCSLEKEISWWRTLVDFDFCLHKRVAVLFIPDYSQDKTTNRMIANNWMHTHTQNNYKWLNLKQIKTND